MSLSTTPRFVEKYIRKFSHETLIYNYLIIHYYTI